MYQDRQGRIGAYSTSRWEADMKSSNAAKCVRAFYVHDEHCAPAVQQRLGRREHAVPAEAFVRLVAGVAWKATSAPERS